MADNPTRELITPNVAERLQRFRELFEQSPSFAAVLLGPQHIFVAANPAFHQLIGQRTVMGMTVRDALPDIQDPVIYDIFDTVFKSGQAYSGRGVPVRLVPAAGEPSRLHYLDVVLQPVLDLVGQVAAIFVLGADATEAHSATVALSVSEARFRAAVDAVQGVLWTNKAAGEMQGEQPGWAALTGQAHDEYQGFGWAAAVHPDDAQPTIDAWNAAVAERRLALCHSQPQA